MASSAGTVTSQAWQTPRRGVRTVTTLHSLITSSQLSHCSYCCWLTSHNLHCLPAWCHSVTSHHLSAHNNQRMFDSATHEFLKFFYQLKILRFKYVGHQGTRDHVRGVKQILIIQILRLRGDVCRGREGVSSDVISNYVRQPQLQT